MMAIALRTADSFAAHAVCVAAGVRDGMRAAQYYVRDLARADNWGNSHTDGSTSLSVQVARAARVADRFMTWTTNTAIRMILPEWRKLPSPFAPGMMREVKTAIRHNGFVQNPLFNAYFFRAAHHILYRYAQPPFLVLEHRVDAARRRLANQDGQVDEFHFLARALIALVETGPVARMLTLKPGHNILAGVEANLAVCAIACVTLLFAEEGRLAEGLDENKFFSIVGALIEPRLPRIEALVSARDEQGLAAELAEIKAMY